MKISAQPLIDLLLFHRQGDNNLFQKLVEQWISLTLGQGCLAADMFYVAYKIRSNLSALGFIDSYKKNGIRKWSSVEPSAISLRDEGYLLYLHQYQLNEIPKNNIHPRELFAIRGSGTLFYALTIPFIVNFSGLDEVPRIKPDYKHLLSLLPKISDAINDENICIIISGLSTEMGLENYNFLNDQWKDADDFTIRGLYKQKYRFGSNRYFIVDRYFDGLIYEIVDPAWVYILAHEILQENISIFFNTDLNEAKIIPRNFYKLPPVLQRILISDTLIFPKYRNGYLVLLDSDISGLENLSKKFIALRIVKDEK